MSDAQKGVIYLVGAGPGDPELLTLRAASLLASADIIFHDDLVPQAILDCAHAQAIIISVGKRCGKKRITQEEIHALMIHAAQSGQSVVRLKSGDPLVFGRAAEEMEALAAANIPFHVVPGITAAFAAAATLHTSLTDRRTASKIIFATGRQATHPQRKPNTTNQDDAAVWQGALPEDATLIVYMPGRDYRALASNLLQQGLLRDMPCIAVSCAGQPEQTIDATTLEHLAELEAGPAPVLLLIGRPMAIACERNAKVAAKANGKIDATLLALHGKL
ncbi:MAG TPA: uroporphyrinogen-III C-methyltransferase [Acidobacteriaceae bacterium]|nr:uroporphyrinogen-III C-methyltransferase [Acidobacteriaceae bacterium]